MKEKIRIIALFLAVSFVIPRSSFSEEKFTAAVLDLEAQIGIDQRTANLLSDSLRSSLHKAGLYRLLTRESMETILKEQKFQLSGCTSTECVIKAGRLLGARKVFSGTIGKVGTTYVVTL
ncbi:MAG: CsgG/HfaB family protein, partial [Candidatus Omnitrophota bacterium]